MKSIRIDFIEQKRQAYPTLGNYGEDENGVWFEITEFPAKPAYSVAILLHEIAEFYRNKQDRVTVDSVDAFDLAHPELDDPGLSKAAPYHRQHMEADALERLFILFSGEDWVDYEAACNNLYKETY